LSARETNLLSVKKRKKKKRKRRKEKEERKKGRGGKKTKFTKEPSTNTKRAPLVTIGDRHLHHAGFIDLQVPDPEARADQQAPVPSKLVT
jgi:hypothetical protein